MNAARAYKRNSEQTASKERLMVMLFEAALRHIRLAATLMEEGKFAEANPLMMKASDIVAHLAETLDTSRAPELAQTLGEIYVFTAQKIARAGVFKEAKALHDAARAFAPIVEGFQQAVASMGTP